MQSTGWRKTRIMCLSTNSVYLWMQFADGWTKNRTHKLNKGSLKVVVSKFWVGGLRGEKETCTHQPDFFSIIQNSFMFKKGNRRYKYLVLGHEESYFVKEDSYLKHKYSEDDIIKMLEFLVDNIFVVFARKVFQQIVGIPMGTNCAPLLADIFLYSYEAEFIQSLLSIGRKQLASRFNFTYRYIDDVLSINNPEFENYLGQMYPVELEIKDTTESNTSASYLDFTSICRSGGTVNFTLPFMTNVTISISTSQIFRSWVAIFQPRPPMASLFRSLYGMPGLAPRMDVLSWGQQTTMDGERPVLSEGE